MSISNIKNWPQVSSVVRRLHFAKIIANGYLVKLAVNKIVGEDEGVTIHFTAHFQNSYEEPIILPVFIPEMTAPAKAFEDVTKEITNALNKLPFCTYPLPINFIEDGGEVGGVEGGEASGAA